MTRDCVLMTYCLYRLRFVILMTDTWRIKCCIIIIIMIICWWIIPSCIYIFVNTTESTTSPAFELYLLFNLWFSASKAFHVIVLCDLTFIYLLSSWELIFCDYNVFCRTLLKSCIATELPLTHCMNRHPVLVNRYAASWYCLLSSQFK